MTPEVQVVVARHRHHPHRVVHRLLAPVVVVVKALARIVATRDVEDNRAEKRGEEIVAAVRVPPQIVVALIVTVEGAEEVEAIVGLQVFLKR